jgi:acetyl esterase/lipase
MNRKKKTFYLMLLFLCMGLRSYSQRYSSSINSQYRTYKDITYLEMGSWEGKLDIYSRQDTEEPQPTLIWIHGGSSMRGSKEYSMFNLLPYLEKGFNVINIEHRYPGLTLAPAALQNSWCALNWIYQNAQEYNVDTTRLVISGASSGGWFAIASAMTKKFNDWDEPCPGSEHPPVAAVVNWFGNWDLADVLEGTNVKSYASGWVRNLPNPMEVAKSLYPIPFDGRAVPSISIHGDADNVVPYTQSVRLHEALKSEGIASELVTIQGGRHGGFSLAENEKAYKAIWVFLDELGITPD